MVIFEQPRFQGLSCLPPLVVGTDTLVAAGHVTTQNLDGRKICWKGGATGFLIVTLTNLLSTTCTWVPTHPAVLDGEMVTWPAATRVSVPTTKDGREERPWERGCATFSLPRLFRAPSAENLENEVYPSRSTKGNSGVQNLDSGIHKVESRIHKRVSQPRTHYLMGHRALGFHLSFSELSSNEKHVKLNCFCSLLFTGQGFIQ